MKQKNLAMLGVAVGCGLVAAVAVAKLSAGNSRGPDTTKVLVAKRDLPVQTVLEEKDLDNLLGWADMPKNLVPPDAATDIEAIKGKSLNRTLKQGNPLSITDVGTPKKLTLPDGCKAITVRATQADAVAGFVKPGDRVDILFVERMNVTGKNRSAILLRKMLVLAVNMTNNLDEKSQAAIPQVESVSLAVNNDWQGNRLTLAEEKGKLKFMLTSALASDNTPDSKEGEIEWLVDPFDPAPTTQVVTKKDDTPPPAGPRLEQAVVARKTVPLNTLINADNVGEYFATVELKTVPDGVVKNPDDLKGFFVVRSVEAGQYMYKSLTGKEVVQIEKPPPAGPVAPPPTVVQQPITAAKHRFPKLEQVFQAGGQAYRVYWLEIAPGKWKRFDTEREANEYKPEPDAPKADEKSDSGKAEQ
jgi:Flp pilus assembly protein CpaB